MSLTLDDLFTSPDHYLHSFEGDAAVFVPMDRAAYHRSIFLDRRISPAANRRMTVPLSMLTGAPQAPATGWIFHIAHCGSTLLARALDRPHANLVLREPLALRQAAIDPDPTRLTLAAGTAAKRYDAALPTVVKANVPVNFLLEELAARDPAARSIFLYLALPDYLLAILRDEAHRQWLRQVTGQLALYLGDLGAASDAHRAAVLWLAQMEAFAAIIPASPNARSLNAEEFFARPAQWLPRAAQQLEVPLTDDEAHAIVNGPLFSTYSKNDAIAFDNAARVERRERLANALAPEIEAARALLGDRAETALAAVAAAGL